MRSIGSRTGSLPWQCPHPGPAISMIRRASPIRHRAHSRPRGAADPQPLACAVRADLGDLSSGASAGETDPPAVWHRDGAGCGSSRQERWGHVFVPGYVRWSTRKLLGEHYDKGQWKDLTSTFRPTRARRLSWCCRWSRAEERRVVRLLLLRRCGHSRGRLRQPSATAVRCVHRRPGVPGEQEGRPAQARQRPRAASCPATC